MSGKKGCSGGPRVNAGGARPGAGRKSKASPEKSKNSANADRKAIKAHLEPQPHGGALKRSKSKPVPLEDRDMLDLLKDVALGRVEASALQVRAAIAAVQYTHMKKGDGGKKDEAADKAKKAASRFAPSAAPPRLVVSNREK